MSASPLNRRRRSAFTLLELLLALGMVSVLVLTLFMSLNIVFRARASAATSMEPVRVANLAVDLARQDFESVVPPPSSTSDTVSLAGPFIGTFQTGADSVVFHTVEGGGAWASPAARPVGGARGNVAAAAGLAANDFDPLREGIHRVEIGLRTDVNPPVLVRRISRNLLTDVVEEPEEEILCRDVRSFTLRYLDPTTGTWQEDWDSTALGDVLPAAVQITLEINHTRRAGEAPRPYKVVRYVPLACAKPDDGTTGGLQ